MNNCYDRHDPKYKITYYPTKTGGRHTEWHVCEWCYEKKPFGNLDDIQSLTKLAVC